MKNLLLTNMFGLCYFLTFGQTLTKNINNRLLQKTDLTRKVLSLSLDEFDFSPLFTHTDNSVVYGFIGDNYQRIRVKFLKVTKSQSAPENYLVYGKSMVKDNVCEFRGLITISNIRKYKTISYGADDEYKNKGIRGQYVILGTYNFSENEIQAHTGTFTGTFQSNFYLDKDNKVHYDDIADVADGYTNNQFTGRWVSHKINVVKKCNWGDFRVPNSGDLDIGAGEFSPNEKYLKYGWQTTSILMVSPNNKTAKRAEEAEWWK